MNDINNLDEIRQQKLAEMQQKMQQQFQQQIQQQHEEREKVESQIEQLEYVIKSLMTKDALARYGNIKTADPEKAVQLLLVIAQLMRQNQISTIDDETLKQILIKTQTEKHEIKIRRK